MHVPKSEKRHIFTIKDLGMAYRKAKVDIFYTSDPRPLDLLSYEEDLEGNLGNLLDRINKKSLAWVKEPKFLGTHSFVPKTFEADENISSSLIYSSPSKKWKAIKGNQGNKALFRLMSECSIDFHVVSALWITHVGSRLDKKLGESARANRLRRKKNEKYNKYSSGSFNPYLPAYKRWTADGFDAMKTGLSEGKSIIAVTADATNFYHNLDPSFLLSDKFFQESQIDRSDWDSRTLKLHELFVNALIAWDKLTSQKFGLTLSGLPVGLPASGIVANIALLEFDRVIDQEVAPLYYGRYVDDIFLVFEGSDGLTSAPEVWSWLERHTQKKLESDTSDRGSLSFSPAYLGKSNIKFENKKNKVFFLEGSSGLVLVDSIKRAIEESSSEWRSLPMLPEDPSHIATSIVEATHADGSPAENLRSTEKLSASRRRFSIKLRNFEAYARDLDPNTWIAHRKAFYATVLEHVFVLPLFFDLANFFPRILKFAILCRDIDVAVSFVTALAALSEELRTNCKIKIASAVSCEKPDPCALCISQTTKVLNLWADLLCRQVQECFSTATPHSLEKSQSDELKSALRKISPKFTFLPPTPDSYSSLFLRDLAAIPFRESFFPPVFLANHTELTHPVKEIQQTFKPLSKKLLTATKVLARQVMQSGTSGIPGYSRNIEALPALIFPTRPLGVAEIFTLSRLLDTKSDQPLVEDKTIEILSNCLFAARGFSRGNWGSSNLQAERRHYEVHPLPFSVLESEEGRIRIALASLATSQESWIASVHRKPDLSRARYSNLVNLINSVLLLREDKPHYLVLPEGSVPAAWFIRFANKLKLVGISLIAGIEYIHAGKNEVHNQTWASLVHDGLGFRTTAIYRQDKLTAAPAEAENLWNQAGLVLKPERVWSTPPIISHGDFRFSLLVCSELTNIHYRAALSGNVDALIVPEWNQDLNTFGALVEASALDMHAYIVQVNNRNFGDSRLRAPGLEPWERDLVKISGGLHDHFVVGTINIHLLREFQSQNRAPKKNFKPLPDGFAAKFDERRKRTPRM